MLVMRMSNTDSPQHGRLLEQCGLATIMKTIRTRPPDVGAFYNYLLLRISSHPTLT